MAAPHPSTADDEVVMLPAATRDFILQALGETSAALSRTHGLRATRRLLVEEGTLITQDNSFRINHLNQLLLMNLIRRMLMREAAARGAPPAPRRARRRRAAAAQEDGLSPPAARTSR